MANRFYRATEKMMGMSDATWSRHANPWSVWTRMTCLPLIVLAIWSRTWLGVWALLPLAAALFWTWYNPRAFRPPKTWDSWAAKGTSGERVFLHFKDTIAPHHRKAAHLLAAASAIGLPPLIYGLWVYDLGWTIAGLVLVIVPKLWFVDRMVWIWEDWLKSGKTHTDLTP